MMNLSETVIGIYEQKGISFDLREDFCMKYRETNTDCNGCGFEDKCKMLAASLIAIVKITQKCGNGQEVFDRMMTELDYRAMCFNAGIDPGIDDECQKCGGGRNG